MVEVVSLQTREPEEKTGFCHTPTAGSVINTLAVCHKLGEMGYVVGEPGVGKTAAVKAYAESTSGAHVVTMSPSAGTLQPCLMRIAKGVHAYLDGTGAADIREAIIQRLGRRDGPTLLVLDEAQHLCDLAIEEVRSIHDEIDIGVVFVGNRGLIDRWQTKPGSKRGVWGQITSRLMVRLDIAAPQPEDIAALCDRHAIAGKRPRDLLMKAAGEPGGLRVVVKLIGIAEKLATGRPIEMRHLEEAAHVRGLGR